MPPVPAFYARPATLDDIVNHPVGCALDLLGINNDLVRRRGETVGIGDGRWLSGELPTGHEHPV